MRRKTKKRTKSQLLRRLTKIGLVDKGRAGGKKIMPPLADRLTLFVGGAETALAEV